MKYLRLATLALTLFAGCFGAPCRKCEAGPLGLFPRCIGGSCCTCGPNCPAGGNCSPCLCAPAAAEASAPANRLAVWYSGDGGRTWQFVRWYSGNGPV